MKKQSVWALVLCLALLLTACAGEPAVATPEPGTPAPVDAPQTPVEPEPEETALNDATVDVLVIGAGGAGLSAAVSAAENGASVIVVEKMSMTGGNTLRCGGAFNSYDPEGQANVEMTASLGEAVEKLLAHEVVSDGHQKLIDEVRGQYEAYKASGSTALFDSPEWHALQTLDAGDYIGNIELIRTLTNSALPTKQWLATHGVEWSPDIRTVVGALWNRSAQTTNTTGADFIKALEVEAAQNGALLYLDTKAETLLVEGGAVKGAVITNEKGESVTVRANKGVIIATGGFGANVEMRVKYNKHWPDLGESIKTNNHAGATGDGILMGEAAGGALLDMEWIQLMPLNPVSGGGISGYVNNAIYVNKEGKRYVNEDNRRDVLAAKTLEQTDSIFFIINDQTEVDSVSMDQGTLDYMVTNGMMFSGETPAELAAAMGVDPAALTATIEEYNKCVDAQKDEFGRALWGAKLENPPYYAASYSPAVHHTMGGLMIDMDTHVIGTDGNIIPGLYAAGEVTGGIHGTNRVGGNAVPDALCFGKIAGQNAAK